MIGQRLRPMGPAAALRGIDNKSYYSLVDEQPRYYDDFAGTGNVLELFHPHVLRMVTDSLRYWVEEKRVDGFRFNLATTPARVAGEFNEHASFLDAVAQDPLLATVKLIAEPWDIGRDGYQLGSFPPGWAEWNDRYRDTVRRFWKGDQGQLPELASRLPGSSDIFGCRGRRPWASVNFVTAHDGFTLEELVSYNGKHNEANLEDNKDGNDQNYSWNCGEEGPTGDSAIRRLREQQKRNLLATLLLSQGLPMLLSGDEFGHSQQGNNNAYCQDHERTWLDWGGIDDSGRALQQFTRALIRLRQEHIVFHRHRFFHGGEVPGASIKDIAWLKADGEEMNEEDWQMGHAQSIALFVSGEPGAYHLTVHGEREPDDSFMLILNACEEPVEYRLPRGNELARPRVALDTAADKVETGLEHPVTDPCIVAARALIAIRYPREGGAASSVRDRFD